MQIMQPAAGWGIITLINDFRFTKRKKRKHPNNGTRNNLMRKGFENRGKDYDYSVKESDLDGL